jgi:hypothetical protein
MAAANGTMGRRLVSLARRSTFELVATFAWVGHHTSLEHGGPARTAAECVAANARRDPELAPLVDGRLADLERQALDGELLYSIDDYAVLLRAPAVRRASP